MQLPPPVHGQSIMNQTIQQSNAINNAFKIHTIPLQFSSFNNLGKADVRKFFKMFYYAFLLIKTIKRFKPDLIYFTLSPVGFAFYRDCLYVMILKYFQVPIVYHLHGKGIKEHSKNRFQKLLYAYVFKRTSIILLSKMLQSDINEVVDKSSKIFYLPNGIRNIVLPQRMYQNSSENKPTLLFLSNIVKTKGVLDFLEALSFLQKKQVPYKAFLVGEISASVPKKLLFKKITDYNLGDNVQYIGALYGNDKNRALVHSDIFVFPTYREAFPLVILEAMRAGLPIISTFEGAIPEIVENNKNGFLVNQRDVLDLANKLETLIKEKDKRSTFGKRSLKKFKTLYTVQTFEGNLTQIFNQILKSNS